jgi:hypothetical protein
MHKKRIKQLRILKQSQERIQDIIIVKRIKTYGWKTLIPDLRMPTNLEEGD